MTKLSNIVKYPTFRPYLLKFGQKQIFPKSRICDNWMIQEVRDLRQETKGSRCGSGLFPHTEVSSLQ